MPASSFSPALSAAFNHALDHLSSPETSSVAATASLATLRHRIDLPLNQASLDPAHVITDLAAGVQGGLLATTGGRFFGWVIGGSLPAALAADWLTSAWNQNAGLYATAPAAAVVEETAGRWLKEIAYRPSPGRASHRRNPPESRSRMIHWKRQINGQPPANLLIFIAF